MGFSVIISCLCPTKVCKISKSGGVTLSVSFCLPAWNSIYQVLYTCHAEGCDVDHIQSYDGERLRQWATFECVLASSTTPLDGIVPLRTFPICLAPLGSTVDQSSCCSSPCYKVWLSDVTGSALLRASQCMNIISPPPWTSCTVLIPMIRKKSFFVNVGQQKTCSCLGPSCFQLLR